MALFDRFAKLAQARADLVQGRLNPFGTRIDEILSPPKGVSASTG
ncbi:hypothetical protein ACFSHR_20670 [Azotobacter chroococcum]